MSTITVTQKSKSLSIFDKRNLSLIILGALVIFLIALVTISATAPSPATFDYTAYMLHRQGEWVSVPLSSAQAYNVFRRGEVVSAANPAEAYRLFRLGEWATVNAAGLSAYHQSERTFVDPNAGLTMYHNSERSRIPVRFNQYQLSEWFGN